MKLTAIALFLLVTVLTVVSTAPLGKRADVPGMQFDRFFIVVFENKDYTEVAKHPYFTSLAKKGVLLSNFHAITHPSQPNYIAMISASTGALDNDNHDYTHANIVDLFEAKGISWKAYQEDYLGNCYVKDSYNGLYYRKHNPFISFTSISSNPARCAKIVNAKQLDTDIANGDIPQFGFYTPNEKNDGHETSLTYAGNWLKQFIEPKLNNAAFMKNMVILITFDEDGTEISSNKNRVFSILLGGAVRASAGTVDSTLYTHYSIPKTLQDNWNLGNLGQNDMNATPFKNLGKA
ncbi:hypothetical protein BGW41_000474 [Actinomortierella wolfii]|nr:hypothetical protein BGW41_000474 [Actinomortierella wolfii]